MSVRLPNQRWQIAPANPEKAVELAQLTQLSPLLAQVLINRGIVTPDAAQTFLEPELQQLPSPLDEFPDLPIALELLLRAIASRQPIAICGDYDADGMTSTALLLRALRYLGAIVDYAIPSRMQEGYGINRRIVEEFHDEGVGLILTVDNGIAAYDPIARARELGLTVIVTDHHDIPEQLPPAHAILNPKLIHEESLYRGIAGVGVAYVLAICLAQCLRKTQDLTTPLLELFTLGTIADLAPLTGVNRRWVRRGLKLLPKSRIPGIQALIQVAGLSNEKELKPEAIGFRLGPRINAIGRISDPQLVIELLTTEDDGQALELAMKCEQVNQLRQRLCELIEQEAIAWCEQSQINFQNERVLVVVQPEWHHGVIGIVASRLVERYGVPVFIGTYEGTETSEVGDSPTTESVTIRGSARGIPEFNVFEALQFCDDILEKYGGHRAAGGFSLKAENLDAFRSRLSLFANGQLQPEHLKPLVTIDVQANFLDLTFGLYEQINALHPCGIENPDPVFWTPNVRVLDQQTIGRDRTHLKLTLIQNDSASPSALPPVPFKAIAWRWGEYFPIPNTLDVAYRLRLNEWNGVRSVELELVGVRSSQFLSSGRSGLRKSGKSELRESVVLESDVEPELSGSANTTRVSQGVNGINVITNKLAYEIVDDKDNELVNESVGDLKNTGFTTSEEKVTTITPSRSPSVDSPLGQGFDEAQFLQTATTIEFYFNKRKYTCGISQIETGKELRIRNSEGQVLAIQPQQRRGLLGKRREDAKEIDVSHPYYFNLIRAALSAIELAQKEHSLAEKKQLIAVQDQKISTLNQQVELLHHELTQRGQDQPNLERKLEPDLEPDLDLELQPDLKQEPPLESLPDFQLQDVMIQVQETVQVQETQVTSLSESVVQTVQDIHTPELPSSKPEDCKRQARRWLGDAVWRCLNSHSQKDLATAVKHQNLIQLEALTVQDADYSEAGLRLGFAIEREVIQPFFKHLHQFLLNNGGTDEIGGITLRVRKKYTLGMLPPLLAAQWYSFKETILVTNCRYPDDELYCTVKFDQVSQKDRNTVKKFLNQWQHPIAYWLVKQDVTAASTIDQINKLRNIAAHGESALYHWQYELLQALVMGNETKRGLFKEIYDS